MNRIGSVMVMQARDRLIWFLIPAIDLGLTFAIVWFIALSRDVLMGGINDIFTGALAALFIVMLAGGIGTIGGTYPFAVGFGARRREYLLGTLAMAGAVSAGWAIVLSLLSFIEAHVIKNWGVGMHFFYLPWFSDGSSLRRVCWGAGTVCAQADPSYLRGTASLAQAWVFFVLLLFMSLLGLLLGSIYYRFGRTGVYIFLGVAFLLLSVFVLASTYWNWWGAIFGWLARQSAATLGVWLVPLIAFFALVSYALLRKATV